MQSFTQLSQSCGPINNSNPGHRLQVYHHFAMVIRVQNKSSLRQSRTTQAEPQDLICAGYQWTMVQKFRHNKNTKDLQKLGKIAHLIIERSLASKQREAELPSRAANKVVHVGGQTPPSPSDGQVILRRQLNVQKGGFYDLEGKQTGSLHLC